MYLRFQAIYRTTQWKSLNFLLTYICEFCVGFIIGVNILSLCVLFHKKHEGIFFYFHVEAMTNICLKATYISDLVSAANIKWMLGMGFVNFVK
jgi:hypothetical protein